MAIHDAFTVSYDVFEDAGLTAGPIVVKLVSLLRRYVSVNALCIFDSGDNNV